MEEKLTKISFVGDIMCKRKQIDSSKTKTGYDFDECFAHMKSFFEKSDYVVGNLETPICKDETDLTTEKFSFGTPIEFLKSIKENGFDLVTTANNHSLDRGKEGLLNTIEALNKYNIAHIGTYNSKEERDKVFVIEINGIKFSFITYTYGTNANINYNYLKENERYMVNLFRKQEKSVKKYNIIRRFKRKYLSKYIEDKFKFNRDKKFLEQVKKDIEKAKEVSDYVFFCMHSGGQYNEGPEDYTKKLMDYLIENGVDFVIGAHPHVVHGIKKYDKGFGAYSLGNFYAIPYANPMQKDDMPDYSIILNFYFCESTKKLQKITYSIAKSEIDDKNFTKVKLVNEIYNNSKNKEKIKEEALIIANKFSGKIEKELLEEYEL